MTDHQLLKIKCTVTLYIFDQLNGCFMRLQITKMLPIQGKIYNIECFPFSYTSRHKYHSVFFSTSKNNDKIVITKIGQSLCRHV